MPTYNFKHQQFKDELRWDVEIDVYGLTEAEKEAARAEAKDSILASMGAVAYRPEGFLMPYIHPDEAIMGIPAVSAYSSEIKRRIEKWQFVYVCTGISLPYLPA